MTEKPRRRRSGWARAGRWAFILIGFGIIAVGAAPELLAWPYRAERGSTIVYSNAPIPPQIDTVLARTDALLATSPLNRPLAGRRIFLTGGGWRWPLLALTSSGAFALRRPYRDAIIVNRADVAADRVSNGAEIGGTRSLSGTLAHEFTHVLVARRYGEFRAARIESWRSEGYADHVAQESSLSDGDYRRLRASGADHPALRYYEGRRRVEALLRANNGDPDRLFGGE